MTANAPGSDWTAEVIGFLTRNRPARRSGAGWEHKFTTAYQIGCKALVALGQAKGTVNGAVPLENPRLPHVLPRWDDVCVAVLWLVDQQDMLLFLPDGDHLGDGGAPRSPMSLLGNVFDASPPPASNIAATQGLGPADAEPEILSVLQALGLIAQGSWTSAAEPVLWRSQPQKWEMEIWSDPRFAHAVEQALVTIPEGIRAEIDRLVTITEADVAAAVARYAVADDERRAQYGPEAPIEKPAATATARKTLEVARRNALDWLFFRHWRLADGWLSPEEAERALEIFHDRLAIAMRRAVIARLYPDLPSLADQ